MKLSFVRSKRRSVFTACMIPVRIPVRIPGRPPGAAFESLFLPPPASVFVPILFNLSPTSSTDALPLLRSHLYRRKPPRHTRLGGREIQKVRAPTVRFD